MKVDAGTHGYEGELDVDELAADWHTRLNDEEPTPAVRAAFEAWIASAPEHRMAYARIERMWSVMGSARADDRVSKLRTDALASARPHKRKLRIVAASVALVTGVGLLAASSVSTDWWRGAAAWVSDRPDDGGSFRTSVGERSTVALTDGSTVELNTHTQINVQFSTHERRIQLVSGQAWFRVAPNPQRPFVVDAGGQRVIAVGTEFDVRLDERSEVRVTLSQGKVLVEPSPSLLTSLLRAEPVETQLNPGDELIATGRHSMRKTRADMSKVVGWRRGHIVFNDDSLAAAVKEINRYTADHIELADPSLGNFRVSGVFNAGSNESFLQVLTAQYPVRISARTADRVVLTSAAPEATR